MQYVFHQRETEGGREGGEGREGAREGGREWKGGREEGREGGREGEERMREGEERGREKEGWGILDYLGNRLCLQN